MKKMIPDLKSRIVFYMLIKQMQRCSDHLEEAHNEKLSQDCNEAVASAHIKYYKNEQAVLLGMMSDILETAKEVPEEEEENVDVERTVTSEN